MFSNPRMIFNLEASLAGLTAAECGEGDRGAIDGGAKKEDRTPERSC
jgi:hypothetical protein